MISFVICNPVLLDECDEIPLRVAFERGFAEMRVGRKIVTGIDREVREVTAAAARHQYFLADLAGMLDQHDVQATLPGDCRTEKPRGSSADDDDIMMIRLC